MANFATSEGWNWSPAMLIHRFAPLTSWPMTRTLSSRAMLIKYRGHAA